MQFGNLSGLIAGTETVVYDYEVTGSATQTISTGSILNGNEDEVYTIIIRMIGGAASSVPYIRLNNDSGTNYGWRGISTASTTVADANANGQTQMQVVGCNSGETAFSVSKLYAKSGNTRFMNTMDIGGVATNVITTLRQMGQVWSDTTNNLTSITFTNAVASGYGIGTRIIILKQNNFTGGTPTGTITTPYIKGSWVRVGSSVLGASTTSVTFSSLDGDRDVIWYLEAQVKSDGSIYPAFRPNNDSTAAVYGYQYSRANNTAIDAARGSDVYAWLDPSGYAANFNSVHSMFMFSKSGYIRPFIVASPSRIDATPLVTYMQTVGGDWNNTGTNITSLVITTQTGANFVTGSQFFLYALRPNG